MASRVRMLVALKVRIAMTRCFENKCKAKSDEGGECAEDEHCMEDLKCENAGEGGMPTKSCHNSEVSGSTDLESSGLSRGHSRL